MNLKDLLKLVPDLKKLIVNVLFRGQEPSWLSPVIDAVLLIVIVLLGIWGLLFVLSQIKKIWTEHFLPLFYNQEERRRTHKRQRFAAQIDQEIRLLNNREEWKDYRFTELEAEVEAEGRRKGFSILPFFQPIQRGLRREQSLSKALEVSSERLILVEGEPGSGKSIALRHVAEKMVQQALRNKNKNSVIPLYINLKKLERKPSDSIDRELIESFVKNELYKINDRDVEQFLEEEFQKGLEEKKWLFLFDSFDETPEILSSVEADKAIKNYAEAIDNFLSGFNQCRGVIASRQFRGPKHLGWPRFRILPLERRRLELIRKAELPPEKEKILIRQVQIASQEILEMTKNPMFLGILCEDMRSGNPFPENAHSVFERYLDQRLTRDQERLGKRFNLNPTEIRTIAERVAFSISMDRDLGLSPTREAIQSAMNRLNLRVPGNFDQFLNALEYLKLARSETETIPGESKSFTFAHRRFQEYFATCVVLRERDRISPRELLTNGRWRETAVVIFQTQSSAVFSPMLVEAQQLLEEMLSSISGLIDAPIEYVNQETIDRKSLIPKPFSWPPGMLHILGLLQDGFVSRIKDLPDDIQMQIGRLLLSASVTGTLADKKWSLEVAGIAPQPVLLWLLRNAFANQSQWLKEVAYRQAARLDKIPDDVAVSIRQALLSLFARGRLHQERFATEAHLSRLDQSAKFLNVMQLLRWIEHIDSFLHVIVFLVFCFSITKNPILLTLFGIFLLNSRLVLQNIANLINDPLWNKQSLYIGKNTLDNHFLLSLALTYFRFALVLVLKITLKYIHLVSFLLLWAVFALLAAKTGEFNHPLWWLLLLIYPILYLAKNFRPKKIINLCALLFKNFRLVIYVVSFIVLLECLMVLVFFVIKILVIPIVIIGLLLVTVIVLPQYVQWIKDWIKWRIWLKKPSLSITIQELLNLIQSYHYCGFCKRLLAVICERNSLIAIEESDILIKQLAFAIESALSLEEQRIRKERKIRKKTSKLIVKIFPIQILSISYRKRQGKKQIFIPSESIFLNVWLENYTRKDKNRLIKFGHECLDEISILSERVHASKLPV